MLNRFLMPFILLVASLIALLVSSMGAARPARAPSTPGDGVTVMTFNIQHGIGAKGRYDLQRVVELIAKINPDVVGLQETTRNHPKYDCDDQPKRLAEGLTRATGREWHQVYQQEWFTPDVSCRDSGRGDGKETEGLTVLSPHAIEKAAHTDLFNTRIGLAVRIAPLRDVPIIVTHLASGAKGAEDRHKQVGPLLAWAEGLGSPRILMGDFNMAADADEIKPVVKGYHDAWVDAQAAGRARGVAGGGTRVDKAGRIDYLLFTPGNRLSLDWLETVDSKALMGDAVSDHQPVVAHFKVR